MVWVHYIIDTFSLWLYIPSILLSNCIRLSAVHETLHNEYLLLNHCLYSQGVRMRLAGLHTLWKVYLNLFRNTLTVCVYMSYGKVNNVQEMYTKFKLIKVPTLFFKNRNCNAFWPQNGTKNQTTKPVNNNFKSVYG